MPPTVRLLEFLNFDIDRYSNISYLLPVVVLMSKLKNPRHTATRVRSKMVNLKYLVNNFLEQAEKLDRILEKILE